MNTAQACLAVLSLAAIWLLSNGRPSGQRRGPVFGLAGQPFCLYATWTAGQVGMFILSIVYTALYVRALHREWWKKPRSYKHG